MANRFNKLYHGQATDVVAIMDDNKPALTSEELQLVLTNAMRRIHILEQRTRKHDELIQLAHDGLHTAGSRKPTG